MTAEEWASVHQKIDRQLKQIMRLKFFNMHRRKEISDDELQFMLAEINRMFSNKDQARTGS